MMIVHTGRKIQKGMNMDKITGNCIKIRITCRKISQRFATEGYNSHKSPEPKGFKGQTMKGEKASNFNADQTS